MGIVGGYSPEVSMKRTFGEVMELGLVAKKQGRMQIMMKAFVNNVNTSLRGRPKAKLETR